MIDQMPAILKFVQITNYRSIVDSGKFYVPADGITVFVGQNESGKTSIIDALDVFCSTVIDNEDRADRNKPTEIICTFGLSKKYVQSTLEPYSVELNFLSKFFVENVLDVEVNLNFPEKKLNGVYTIESAFLAQYEDYLDSIAAEVSAQVNEAGAEKSVGDVKDEEEIVLLTLDELEGLLLKMLPIISIFRDDSLLPRSILLTDLETKTSKAAGITGARNFLNVLDVKIESLKEDLSSPTEKETLQAKLNRDFAADFNAFWTQEVVPGNKAKVHIALANVPAGEPNPGAEVLRFTVETRGKHLFPDQRSKGFQWFLSFYLQLMVLAKDSEQAHILLIDEPGAHLHIKAKENLKSVLEQVKKRAQIIYTTHEPELIDTSKLNRVRIVTQVLNQDGSSYEGTKVYSIERSATEFGTADALSPIYRAMGADLSSLKITKERNVILEEPSAYYYLMSWKKILDIREDVAFLPAMGAIHDDLYYCA